MRYLLPLRVPRGPWTYKTTKEVLNTDSCKDKNWCQWKIGNLKTFIKKHSPPPLRCPWVTHCVRIVDQSWWSVEGVRVSVQYDRVDPFWSKNLDSEVLIVHTVIFFQIKYLSPLRALRGPWMLQNHQNMLNTDSCEEKKCILVKKNGSFGHF